MPILATEDDNKIRNSVKYIRSFVMHNMSLDGLRNTQNLQVMHYISVDFPGEGPGAYHCSSFRLRIPQSYIDTHYHYVGFFVCGLKKQSNSHTPQHPNNKKYNLIQGQQQFYITFLIDVFH